MKFPASKLAATALLAVIAVAGCKQESPVPAPESSASTAMPDAKPGLAVNNGVLVLPAVKGRPGAVYFDLVNSGGGATSLAAASVDGAGKAEFHETMDGKMEALGNVEVPPGATVSFARGGKHLMVFDLGEKIIAGSSVELTLTFADGDKISVPLKVEPAGGNMAGMDMGHDH